MLCEGEKLPEAGDQEEELLWARVVFRWQDLSGFVQKDVL